MIDAKQIKTVAEAVMVRGYDYDFVGLRVQESDYGLAVGQEISHHSCTWIDGEMQDDEIDGVCAVSANLAAKRTLSFGGYIGNVIVVLGSNRADSGEDDGEIILKSSFGQEPTVLDIIRL